MRWRAISARSIAGAANSWRWRIARWELRLGTAELAAARGRLVNQSISDGSHGVAGAITVLALDMYEHAYHLDFGPNTDAYMAAFMRNIDWGAVQGRYEERRVKPLRPLEQKQFGDIPAVTVDEVKAMLDSGTPVQIIDTRPRHSNSRAPDMMEGAVWRDPERVDEWMANSRRTTRSSRFASTGFTSDAKRWQPAQGRIRRAVHGRGHSPGRRPAAR